MRKKISLIIFLILISGSVFLTTALVKQRQEIRKRASVPGGQATISISPATATHPVGELFPVEIYFNTANVPLAAISLRLTYSYSGSTPQITASNIRINPALLSTGDWMCPVRLITPINGKMEIDIACAYAAVTGFAVSQNTLLATIDLIANQTPSTNPVILSFDPNQTVISSKADASDILRTPDSTGTYQIGTGPTSSPSPSPTVTPTATVTPTLTVTPTITPSPTGSPPPTNTPKPTNSPPPTPTSSICPRATQGNLSCDSTGIIDTRDLDLFIDSWQVSEPAPTPHPNNASADLNQDNKINETDLTILLANWGFPSNSPTTTPRPTSTPTTAPTNPPSSPTPTSPYPNLVSCPQTIPVEDSYIDQYNPNRIFDNPEFSNNQIVLYKGSVATPQRGLIKFDLSGLTTSINKAYLRLYIAGWSGTNAVINIYQIKQPWTETQVTWNKASGNSSWQVPGADGTNDRLMMPIASITTSGILKYLKIDITNLVKSWLAQPQINQGIMLILGTPGIPDKSSKKSLVILSSEFPHAGGSPCLIIE